MEISSRALATGAAVLVAGAVLVITVRALQQAPATEPPRSTYLPAVSSSHPAASPDASAAPDPSANLSPTPNTDWAWQDGGVGKQIYDVSEVRGAIGPTVRPIDREIFDYIAAGTAKAGMNEDVFPKKPYRVRMLRIGKLGPVTKVWIDMNRNGKWDERWDLQQQQVDRHLSSADDEDYDIDFRLRGGHWLPY